MNLFRKCVNRLIDLSEKDGRSVDECIHTLRYYFDRISRGQTQKELATGKTREKALKRVIKTRRKPIKSKDRYRDNS